MKLDKAKYEFETNEVSTPHDSEILEDLLSDDSEDLRDVLVLNLTDGNNSDVIWNDGGSEIIFRSESISINHSNGLRMINFQLDCDQFGSSIVTVVAEDKETQLQNDKRINITELIAPPLIVNIWGSHLKDSVVKSLRMFNENSRGGES